MKSASDGLATIPVAQIFKGKFVDMDELLRDNLEAVHCGSLQEGPIASLSQTKKTCREVPDQLSGSNVLGHTWVSSQASTHPATCLPDSHGA